VKRAMLLITTALALVATACAGDTTNSPPTSPPDQELTVTMQDIAFEPDVIEVDRDSHVRINFQNTGALVHDFTVDELPNSHMHTTGGMTTGGHGDHGTGAAVHLALASGSSGAIELTLIEPGEYIFYCDEPGHREAGMHGILRVR